MLTTRQLSGNVRFSISESDGRRSPGATFRFFCTAVALVVFSAVWGYARASSAQEKIARDDFYGTLAYRYKLVKSNDSTVCEHMLTVYNRDFRRPFRWPVETFGDQLGDYAGKVDATAGDPRPTAFSFAPTTPEFEAIQWHRNSFRSDGLEFRPGNYQWPFIWADFDVDNDGKIDLVVKFSFFSLTPSDREILWIYAPSTLDLTRGDLTLDDFLRAGRGKGTRYNSPDGAVVRPFVLADVTYLSAYYHGGPQGQEGSAVHPPQTMTVTKLQRTGAAAMPPAGPPVIDVCEFKMIEIAK